MLEYAPFLERGNQIGREGDVRTNNLTNEGAGDSLSLYNF